MNLNSSPTVAVKEADITHFPCDTVVIKYAQRLYGADLAISHALSAAHAWPADATPHAGDYRFFETQGAIVAKNVLQVGVPPLISFHYNDIEEFTHRALEILATLDPTTSDVAMTVHGPGYGLDEVEAFRSQIRGIARAIDDRAVPRALNQVLIVELDSRRARRLDQELVDLSKTPNARRGIRRSVLGESVAIDSTSTGVTASSERLSGVAGSKPHIFVAMPFEKSMDDVFYYGIQNPVHSIDFICERVDQASFTGDILARIKERISTSNLLIAEVTTPNPNVYLEVGYAWGRDVPTLLLTRDSSHLLFDIQTQKSLVYSSIKELEEMLKLHLAGLLTAGVLKR